jgi:hypothetical protein
LATVDEVNMHRDFAQQLYDLPSARRQLIFRIRRQIIEGTYETDKKLQYALDRMVDTLEDADPRPEEQ